MAVVALPERAEPQTSFKPGVTEARLAVSRGNSRETAKRTIDTLGRKQDFFAFAGKFRRRLYRLKDRVHLLDLLEVGLLDETWYALLPPELAARLQEVIRSRKDEA